MSQAAALDEEQLESLALFLEEQAEQGEGLDFFALHGLLTANAISSAPLDFSQLSEHILNGKAQCSKKQQQTDINTLIKLLQKEIVELIESGVTYPVPCELNVEADEDGEAAPLENWSVGFMLLSIEQGNVWYGKFEKDAAELLFPILYASGLNCEDEAFAEIDDDDKLSLQVCASIPDNIVDLFLLYHGEQK